VLHIHNSESENTCSYNSLGKHCQIMFLRTFGGRRPPTLVNLQLKVIDNAWQNIATTLHIPHTWCKVLFKTCSTAHLPPFLAILALESEIYVVLVLPNWIDPI
jgi:hypothetical protein